MGVLGILGLFAGLISVLIAVVFLCIKSMRTKAWPFIVFGLFAVIASAFALGSGFESGETPQVASLSGFPDRTTQTSAAEIGITRYAAYRQLDNESAISVYCDWEAESYELDDQLQAAIEGGGDANTLTAQAQRMQESLRRLQRPFRLRRVRVVNPGGCGLVGALLPSKRARITHIRFR